MDHNNSHSHTDGSSMMTMAFEFSKSCTVLFKWWKFHTVGGLIGSMVIIFILAFGYEALKFYREYLRLRAQNIRDGNRGAGDDRFTKATILSKSHLIQTFLQAVQVIISYFLMLIFMTYNAWLCIAVVLGLVVGYFVFGWRTTASNVNLPPLQLRQRSCCDDTKSSHSFRNLPNYNGYRSEYGLSYRQLKNKHKHIETIRQKEMARQKLIEEYRVMKIQQNESVFCQWLKEVSRRNREKREVNRENKLRLNSGFPQSQQQQKCLSPSVVNINKSLMRHEHDRGRPKTAGFNEFVPKTNIKKKRPSTTQSCVYIELPKSLLKKGIYIGDLLVTNSKKINSKLHILTVTQ